MQYNDTYSNNNDKRAFINKMTATAIAASQFDNKRHSSSLPLKELDFIFDLHTYLLMFQDSFGKKQTPEGRGYALNGIRGNCEMFKILMRTRL